jgi:hypothetical protein
MPRTAPVALGGLVFHVLNRGVARMQLFEKRGDYRAFERVLREIIGRPVGGEKLAAIKPPPLSKIARVELPSHIANIGPVPLSLSQYRTCPAFLSPPRTGPPDPLFTFEFPHSHNIH